MVSKQPSNKYENKKWGTLDIICICEKYVCIMCTGFKCGLQNLITLGISEIRCKKNFKGIFSWDEDSFEGWKIKVSIFNIFWDFSECSAYFLWGNLFSETYCTSQSLEISESLKRIRA